MVPPLPEGEDRGEGKGISRMPTAFESLHGSLWCLVLSGIVAVLFPLLITGCANTRRKSRGWSLVVILVAIFAAICVFFGLSLLRYAPYDPSSEVALKNAYKADFGTLPPAGVTVLKARQIIVGDAGGQWLLLKASPQEIERHIAMGFKKLDAIPDAFDGRAGPNAPKWWQPPTDGLETYENKNWRKDGGWLRSEAVIGVDRGSGLIWFHASKSS